MDQSIIARIQGYGFDVYMRDPKDTYLYFTDGTRIGYLQEDRLAGITMATVHMPNRTTGTGFQVTRHAPEFDKTDLERCFRIGPEWASTRDLSSVVKYKSMEAFIKSDSWRGGYKLVEPVAVED